MAMFLSGCVPEASREAQMVGEEKWATMCACQGRRIGVSHLRSRRKSSPRVLVPENVLYFYYGCGHACTCTFSTRARRLKLSVLGTMADADFHVDAVTVLGECFPQAEIVGDDVKGGCRVFIRDTVLSVEVVSVRSENGTHS